MNSRFKFAVGFLALALLLLCHPNAWAQRTTQTPQNRSASSSTEVSKTASAYDCSLLTPAMIKKVLGDSFRAAPPRKAMPMYGGAWGWSCHYFALDREAQVDFGVYAEASAAKAKHDFETLSIGADFRREAIDRRLGILVHQRQRGAPTFRVEGQGPLQHRDDSGERKTTDLAAAVAARI